MATSTPKPESILTQLKTNLEAITVANSFRNTVASVQRQFYNPERFGSGKFPALAIFGEKMEFEPITVGNSPQQFCVLHFKIQGIIKEYTNPATELLDLMQDVREKIFEDRTVSSNAHNIRIPRVEFGGEPFGNKFGNPPFIQNPYVGFLMDVEVDFSENL